MIPFHLLRPSYDVQLVPIMAKIPSPPTLTRELILAIYTNLGLQRPTPETHERIGDYAISHVERRIPGLNAGGSDITLPVFISTSQCQSTSTLNLLYSWGWCGLAQSICGHRFFVDLDLRDRDRCHSLSR
jgi:hypothetical protein